MTYTIEYLIPGYELLDPVHLLGVLYKHFNYVAYKSIFEPTKNYINASKRFIYMAYQN